MRGRGAHGVLADRTAVRRHIRVRGVVQGVGFRPFVYKLARSLGLCGYVFNSSSGVTIEVEGEAARWRRLCSGCARSLRRWRGQRCGCNRDGGLWRRGVLDSREPGRGGAIRAGAGRCGDVRGVLAGVW